jgi:2-polyprenyl-6-methoxyphenol hydroxylase-like FAD-dependent oxidoreductase
MVMEQFDVVIVGGGIAGSALAAALAPTGIRVLVLERQTTYRDKVRGEFMHPWGVAEVQRLGLEQTLLDAGGGYSPALASYGRHVEPRVADETAVPLSMLLPGVPGAMCVGHPQLSEALNTLAGDRGATVVRGVGDVDVAAGLAPTVRYEYDGVMEEVACRLVVGADGRQSTTRRALHIDLEQATSKVALGGMLVHSDDLTSTTSFIGTEDGHHFLAFPRPNGFARLYLSCDPGAPATGPDRARHMQEAFRLDCIPDGDLLADATPAGPCSYYLGSDSWTDRPFADGVVLIGDAAGWNDPVIGEGLSVTMRDVRLVSEAMLASDDWVPSTFEPYAAERTERMRRLRMTAHVATELRCTFTPEAAARRLAVGEQMMGDPLVFGLLVSSVMGPETGPAEAFTDENLERILAMS